MIVEIVRPGTDEPVPEPAPGQAPEVGELVVTTLNPDYPLIRFGTGDLSAVLPGPCPTGRTAPRIRGWMGRADQTTKVRGMFVHPGQIAQALKAVADAGTPGAEGLGRARLVVSGEMASDHMALKVEHAGAGQDAGPEAQALVTALAAAVRDATKLRCEVALVAPGSLPNDGKVIEDARSYA